MQIGPFLNICMNLLIKVNEDAHLRLEIFALNVPIFLSSINLQIAFSLSKKKMFRYYNC